MIQWNPGMTLEEVEKQIILQALEFHKGNKTQTAAALGCARNTIDNKLLAYEKESKNQDRLDAEEKAEREKTAKRLIHPDAKTVGVGTTGIHRSK